MMQFENNTSISDVIAQIQNKVPDSIKQYTKPEDYFLFRQDPEDERIGSWLNKKANLSDYSVKQGDQLDLKDSNRFLKFKLPDGSIKTIMVNETKIVDEIYKIVCAKSGIVTTDEYSLTVESLPEDSTNAATVTAGKKQPAASSTVKRNRLSVGLTMKKLEERDVKRMEKMKQKLHTDDEILWVEHDKTLSEQGIDESFLLVVRRKYFYESNQNFMNPQEINILYNQCRDSILSGTLLCSVDEATKLAALQLQVQKSNFVDTSFKLTDLKDYFPKEHQKSLKAVEKKLKEEWKLLNGYSEIDARQRYVILCQNLKLYGTSIFLVKEPVEGKSRLTTVLLGITKESILRLDEKTKTVLKSWPVDSVKRWAASPNSFTIDFGDHDKNYTVMTSEPTAISNLLSGYIDLTLKKHRVQATDSGAAGVALMEENIQPGQGVIISTSGQPNKATTQEVGARAQLTERIGGAKSNQISRGLPSSTVIYGKGGVSRVKLVQPLKFTSPREAFLHKLDHLTKYLNEEVENAYLEFEPTCSGLVESPEHIRYAQMQILGANIGSFANSVNQIMRNLSEKENLDYNALNSNTVESKSCLIQIAKAVKLYASTCSKEEADQLEKLLKDLSSSYKRLFDSVEHSDDQIKNIDITSFNDAFEQNSTSIQNMLKFIGTNKMMDESMEDLSAQIKNISLAALRLIEESRKISEAAHDVEIKENIDSDTQRVSVGTDLLIKSVRMLAPVLYYDRNAEFLISTNEDLERKVNVVVRSCEGNKDYPDFLLLKQSAFKLSSEIALLTQKIKDSTDRGNKKSSLQNLLDDILLGMEQLSVEAMDSDELKSWSKDFTSNFGKLLTLMKDDINNAQDDDLKNELLASAKAIAEVTRHLLDNSKALQAGRINSLEFMESQRTFSSEVHALLRNNFAKEIDDIQLLQLKNIIKKVIAASVMMKSSMVNAVESCRSEAIARSLLDESDDLSLAWGDLVDCLRRLEKDTSSIFRKHDLIERAKVYYNSANKALMASRNAIPLIADSDHSTVLNKSIGNMNEPLEELVKYLAQLEDIEDPLRVHLAKQRIQEAFGDLVVLADNFERGKLEKYPEENKDIFNKKLLEIYRETTKIMHQLSDPKNFENNAEMCGALEKLSLTLCRIISPAIGFASCCTNDIKERDECKKIIENIQAIMQASINCCSETEKKIENNNQGFHNLLLEALKQNSRSLVNLLSSLPLSPDLEKASTAIENVNKEYESKKPSPPLHHGKTYLDVQKQFSENLSHILESIAQTLKFVSRNDVEQFSPSFSQFSDEYAKLHRSIKSLISCHPDKDVVKIIEDNLSSVVQLSNQLVSGAKLYVCDPNSSNQLFFTEIAKSFSDILSNVLLTILSSKPGLRECEHGKKIIKLTYLPMLEASNRELFSERSYNESVGEIEDAYTKNFPNIQKNLNVAVQNETSISCIGKPVQDWENLLAIILKNTSHASYLLGMNDSSTVSGRATIFDEDQIKSCSEQMTKAFSTIPTSLRDAKQTDIDAFTRECLKASSCLISSCKESVDALNGHPTLQKEILDIASNLTSKTKESISNLKTYNLCKNDTELEKLIQTNKELFLSEIVKLHLFMESPALECIPARIADRGRLLQDPVIIEGKNVINSMVEALANFCSLVQQMDDHTRVDAVEKIELNKKSIESLIEVLKSQAPGEVELSEIIARLEENHSYIDKISQQVLCGIINISSVNSKEYESRFKLAITKIIEVLNEIASLPTSKLHLKSEKLKILVEIVEGIPDIISGLALSYGSIDQEEKSELFTQLTALNDSFIQCANSSRIIPQKIQNKKPVTFKEAIESSLKKSQKLSDMISALSQKTSGIQTCIQALGKLNRMLKVEGFPEIRHTSMEQKGFEKQVVEKIKNLHKISQDIVGKSTNRSDLIHPRCKDLIDEHEKCSSLIFDNYKKQFPDSDLKEIRKKYIDLSSIMHDFLVSSNSVCSDPSNSELKKELSGTLKKISHSVSDILKLFQSQHKGAEACTILSESIVDSVNDIDTCILFAENGCLEKDTHVLDMNSVKSKIMDNSCKLSEIINQFSKSNKYYDSNILEFTNSLEKSLKEFLEENKRAAVSLGAKEGENQISLLNATKNIGTSMVGLLDSLKTQNADSETDKLKVGENIKVTDEFIQAHKRIFNNVEKNISSGSEAAVHVISHIESMIPYLDPRQPCPWDNSLTQVKPEDLVRISKDIPLSCAKIVQAAHLSKAKDVEEIANKGDATFETLIKGARKLSTVSTDPAVRAVGESLDKCARSYVEMLKLLENSESPSSKRLLSGKGKNVTEAVMEFAKKCSALKSQNFVDMNDPNVLAEQELLNAANAIELAAQKLSELKPRPLNRDEGTNKELNFEGQILDAANSIMKATSFLIAAATSAQKELVQKGVFKTKADDKSGTGQWSQGLISAARLVADSTNMLCDAAKAAVEGKASEEKLIAACNAISGSTSQLIMACKVKADPNSENQARLEKAGYSVKKASKTFVESLQGSGVFERKQENIELVTTKVGGLKQEIDALEEIAKHERELKEARDKLIKLRQAKAAPKKDQ